jgi:propionyl-CoA carboxylase beta chain
MNKKDTLNKKRAESLLGGGKDRLSAQHAKGKLSARERIHFLLDEDSFSGRKLDFCMLSG